MYRLLSYAMMCVTMVTMAYTSAQANEETPPYVQVNGTADVKTVPDEVMVSFVVERNNKNLERVQEESDDIIERVIRFATSRLDVERKYIQTDVFQISPVYEQEQCGKYNRCQTDRLSYFNVRKGITVHLRKIEHLQPLLDEAVKVGVTNIGQINFLSSKQEKLESEARKKAAKDARNKASEVAETLGVQLGDPILVNVNQVSPVFNTRGKMLAMSASAAPSREAIAAGQISISASVNVQFEIED